MRIVFFGTPQFSAEVLEFLILKGVEVVAIISKPDKPLGRSLSLQPVPVKIIAEKHSIPIFQPEKVSAEDFFPILKSFNADVFVVVAYGEILKQHVLDTPKIACINLHTSLLPKWRGAAPIQQAIIHGDQDSGVSIIHMTRKMDAGYIIEQVKTPILPNMTYGELSQELLKLGSESILRALDQLKVGGGQGSPQDESFVTLAPKIELEDCKVEWSKPAQDIHNLIRGVNPEPGAWCLIHIHDQAKRLKLFRTYVHPELTLPIGKMEMDGSKKVLVGTSQGVIELLEVQLEGKKRMNAQDFYRGLPKDLFQMI